MSSSNLPYRIVKKYKKEDVEKTYKDFFALVRKIIEGKNGRIWIMDGDGLLGAYHFLDKSQMSVLSSIKILHELNTYNILHNRKELWTLQLSSYIIIYNPASSGKYEISAQGENRYNNI